MTAVRDLILKDPNFINPHGEEIWEGYGTNLALVRLKPCTYSEEHYHMFTKEIYGILYGFPMIVIDGKEIQLHPGMLITIVPEQVHQIFNHTDQEAIFAVKSNIPWSADDMFVL